MNPLSLYKRSLTTLSLCSPEPFLAQNTLRISGSSPQSSRLAVPKAEGAAVFSSPWNMEKLTVSSRVWVDTLKAGLSLAASLASPWTVWGRGVFYF